MFAKQHTDLPAYTAYTAFHTFHSLKPCVLHELEDISGKTFLDLFL